MTISNGFVAGTFPEHNELNFTISDLADEVFDISTQDAPAEYRATGAGGTPLLKARSIKMFDIKILKDSIVLDSFKDKFKRDCTVGSITFKKDNGKDITILNASIMDIVEGNQGATQTFESVTISGYTPANVDTIGA